MTKPKLTDREALRALVEAYAIRKRPNTLRALAAAREVLARPEPADCGHADSWHSPDGILRWCGHCGAAKYGGIWHRPQATFVEARPEREPVAWACVANDGLIYSLTKSKRIALDVVVTGDAVRPLVWGDE